MSETVENEVKNEVKNDEIRKTRFELLIELANHIGAILNVDCSDERVKRGIELTLQKRDEMLLWSQTALHMYDRYEAEKEAELAKQKEAENASQQSNSTESESAQA